MSKFKRSINDRWAGGVFGGLSRMMGVDSIYLRLAFLILYLGCAMYSYALFVIYLVIWFFVEER